MIKFIAEFFYEFDRFFTTLLQLYDMIQGTKGHDFMHA